MPGKKIKFSRTETVAKSDRLTKWDLIAAIAEDAVEADVPISGAESCVAAKAALLAAGNEYADATVKGLCFVAKFDHESTTAQRKVWRRYGWTNVREVAQAGWSQSAAVALLDGERKLHSEIMVALSTTRTRSGTRASFDDRCAQWVQRANKLMMDGADLLAESEGMGAIGAHAEMALMIYQRISERHLEAEIRRFFETEAVG